MSLVLCGYEGRLPKDLAMTLAVSTLESKLLSIFFKVVKLSFVELQYNLSKASVRLQEDFREAP